MAELGGGLGGVAVFVKKKKKKELLLLRRSVREGVRERERGRG